MDGSSWIGKSQVRSPWENGNSVWRQPWDVERKDYIFLFGKSAPVWSKPATCVTETRGHLPRQPGSRHQNKLMTALLSGLDFMNCDTVLAPTTKPTPLLQSKPFQRHTCGFWQKLSGHLPTSGKGLASLQGENTPHGSTSGCSGFFLHDSESEKVAGWGLCVGTKAHCTEPPSLSPHQWSLCALPSFLWPQVKAQKTRTPRLILGVLPKESKNGS